MRNSEHKFSRKEIFLVTKPFRLHLIFFMHRDSCLKDHLLNSIWFMINVKAIISTIVVFVLIDFSSKVDNYINQNVTACFDSLLFIDSV